MAVTVISRALVGSCPQVSGTWHTANALRGATLQSLQLIAPLIAGTLLALVAPRMLIVIAAITSIIPLLVFARLPLEVRTD